MKKLTENQKEYLRSIKADIINSKHYVSKYKKYFMLVKFLNNNLGLQKKTYSDGINIDYKIENSKISAKDTIIFSLSPALICISAVKGLCNLYFHKTDNTKKLTRKCYALANELQYNSSILFKHRQMIQFKKLKAWQLARYFIKIKKINPNIKYLRINESGDITKKSLLKLNIIADILIKYNIKVYTYTHNTDIKKELITSKNLVINSSNKNIKLSNKFLAYSEKDINKIMSKKSIKIKKCIGNCAICKLCTISKNNIILVKNH